MSSRRVRCMLLACALAALIVDATAAHAQCALRVSPRPGETGYRDRTYACEGLYVQLQSASLNVQVISLLKGSLRPIDFLESALIHVPAELGGLRADVAILGRGREANLNWALDGIARPDKPLLWNLAAVVKPVGLTSHRLGVFGETRRPSGLGGPVYVPVVVTPPGAAPDVPETSAPDSVNLVIRIPAAGAIEYRLQGDAWSSPMRRRDGDGYFDLVLHPRSRGPVDLEVRWRPNGGTDFGAPETLTILFW